MVIVNFIVNIVFVIDDLQMSFEMTTIEFLEDDG